MEAFEALAEIARNSPPEIRAQLREWKKQYIVEAHARAEMDEFQLRYASGSSRILEFLADSTVRTLLNGVRSMVKLDISRSKARESRMAHASLFVVRPTAAVKKTYDPKQVQVLIDGKVVGEFKDFSVGTFEGAQIGASVGKQKVCECGAAKTGAEPFKPGHSTWCPVAEPR